MEVSSLYKKLKENITGVIIGQDETVRMTLAAVFAGGHILIEDVPGSGKTLLAKTLAQSMGGGFKRIQMTPDLLPADITGINIYDMEARKFRFVRGPVFTNILIADEINRATPKTQAGLLEAMEEQQVSVDGTTYPLEEPFTIIATENPMDSQGVFMLPLAQTDRFMVKLSMGYTSHEDFCGILKKHMSGKKSQEVAAVSGVSEIMEARAAVRDIRVSDDVLEYIVNIAEMTRKHESVILGVSQRAALALVMMSKSLAAISGRSFVVPDDVKAAAPYVFAHRLLLKTSARAEGNAGFSVMEEILKKTPVPTEEM